MDFTEIFLFVSGEVSSKTILSRSFQTLIHKDYLPSIKNTSLFKHLVTNLGTVYKLREVRPNNIKFRVPL